MTMRRGADARWTINGVAYAVNRYRCGGRVAPIAVGNTEGRCGNPAVADAIGYGAIIADLREGQIELTQPTFDDDNSPYVAPINLVEGAYYAVRHYPAGLSGDFAEYGNCLCVDVEHEGGVPGPQPVRVVFQTDGAYSHPGQE